MSRSKIADIYYVNLRLIAVSGRIRECVFGLDTSASNVVKHLFDSWPGDWSSENITSADTLKLIYHGRFLHGSITLEALHLPLGRTTVMHVVAREHLPEPSDDEPPKQNKSCLCCTVL